jgi:hypothetical protein
MLIGLALVSVLAAFVPWQRLFFLSDEQATHCLVAKLFVLPVFVLCVLGAVWAARPPKSWHG